MLFRQFLGDSYTCVAAALGVLCSLQVKIRSFERLAVYSRCITIYEVKVGAAILKGGGYPVDPGPRGGSTGSLKGS